MPYDQMACVTWLIRCVDPTDVPSHLLSFMTRLRDLTAHAFASSLLYSTVHKNRLPRLLGGSMNQPHVPDLAVRVRVGAPHDGALVLEDLHPAVPLAQLPRLLHPPLHHGLHLGRAHQRHRHVRLGVEAHHAARPGGRLSPEEVVLAVSPSFLFVLIFSMTGNG